MPNGPQEAKRRGSIVISLVAHQVARSPLSGKDTLSPRVDLNPPFRHLGISKKIERVPNQVSLDLRQLVPNVLGWQELIKDMPRLDSPGREVAVVVLKRFD
jgi:hypothetical protein